MADPLRPPPDSPSLRPRSPPRQQRPKRNIVVVAAPRPKYATGSRVFHESAPEVAPVRRFSLLPLALFAPSAFLTSGPALAQGLVVTPNCGVPGDTIRVKSGGWPSFFPGSTYGYGSALDCAWGGRDTLLARGPVLTSFDRVYVIPEWAEVGDVSFGVVQCVCLDLPACYTCQSTTADSKYVPFRVVADVGNPWTVDVAVVDTLKQMRMIFDPNLWCNTTPCSRIRIIQVMHLLGLKGGSYVPLSFVEGTPPRFIDGPGKEATRIDDHVAGGSSTCPP